ncbi:MAG: MBL fold metallo-hydrolase [Pseudomonadales bacterium]|nr:MBL fold metallo-hydrolase [Pseudomonadales bacterium]
MNEVENKTMKVHQVKGRYVNSYILEQDGKLCVVDVAMRGEKYVMGFITQTLDRPLEDVVLVVCTHGDPDHSGGVMALAKHCRAKVAFPHATHSILLNSINDPTGFLFRSITSFMEMFRPRMWLMYASNSRNVKAKTLPVFTPGQVELIQERKKIDYRLKHKSEIPGFSDWQVMHTPGHSWDSCCFYNESTGELISGDTLLGSKKKGQVVVPSILSNPFQMRRSLGRLRRLNLSVVHPAHGYSVSGEGLLDHLMFWPFKSALKKRA